MTETKIKCRFCKSDNVVRRGLSPCSSRGKQQRYLCKSCRKTFVHDNGFWKMKHSDKTITMSIDMYLSNLSSRKMRNQLGRHFSEKVSHVSVLDWVRKYVMKVNKYVEGLGFNLGDAFFADEIFINRQRKDDRFWACVDWDTRLITGVHYSVAGNHKEAMEFIRKATKNKKPKYIQTDSAQFYKKAFRRWFYSNKIKGTVVEHKIQNYQKTRIHNYKIETVFMKIKDRVKDFRGLKALWSAPILMLGLTIQHNFIKPHTSTNRVPCELAGVQLPAQNNRWLSLIQLSMNGCKN